MKVVSFDPGLRNLAVCVLEGTSRDDIRITYWNIIDVLGEHAGVGVVRCHKCKVSARYEHALNGTFACARHVPKKTEAVTKKALNKKTMNELWVDIEAAGITTSCTKKPELVTLLYNHAKQNTWKKCVSSAKQGSVMDYASALMTCLDARACEWAGADKVVIENQPERRMYAVQAMLQMYFTVRGFQCEGVSATHKLSNMVTTTDVVTNYKGRKKTGITHALTLIPKSDQEHFLKHPKKDDLADSFLQGLWVLEHMRV